MEIPEKGPLPSPPTPNRSAEEPSHPTAEPTAGARRTATGKDIVSLTERGREFKAAAELVHFLPEIREDRVMQVKRQLQEGTYRVKGPRIAENMIHETLENNHLLKHIDTTA